MSTYEWFALGTTIGSAGSYLLTMSAGKRSCARCRKLKWITYFTLITAMPMYFMTALKLLPSRFLSAVVSQGVRSFVSTLFPLEYNIFIRMEAVRKHARPEKALPKL